MTTHKLFLRLCGVVTLLSSSWCIGFAQVASTASIAGSVSDESGRPISGAFVTFVRTGLPPASGQAASGPDGTYSLKNLPAGTYSMCIQVPGGGYLDDCEWSTAPPMLDVRAGQAVTGNQIRLKKGAVVQVRLNDPGKVLTAVGAKAAPDVLMAVRTPRGVMHPVALVSKDANGSTHQVTVPFDTTVKLAVFSATASLSDASGVSVSSKGAEVSINRPSNAPTNAPLTFNVTGLKP